MTDRLLCGIKPQCVSFGGFHRLRAERERVGGSFIPGLPLVHVVRAQEISTLPGDDVQGRAVQVRQVRGEALRGAMMSADGLDCVSAAGLLLPSRTRPVPQDRDSAQDGMLNLDRIYRSPMPGGEIF